MGLLNGLVGTLQNQVRQLEESVQDLQPQLRRSEALAGDLKQQLGRAESLVKDLTQQVELLRADYREIANVLNGV